MNKYDSDIQRWLNRAPSAGETCVFSNPKYWKRDALLFDRVYARVHPSDSRGPDIPIEASFGVQKIEEELWGMQLAVGLGWAMGISVGPKDEVQKAHADAQKVNEVDEERGLTKVYWRGGIMASWSFGEQGLYLRRFSDGESIAYQGALQNLPIVVGDDATWGQILEFRHDKESTRKYRDLKVWLGEGVNAKSAEHAADIIGQKIENYRWAIKKHGLKTITGTITQLFEWKRSGLALAAGGAVAAFGGPLLGALASGLVGLGQIGVHIAEQHISHEEVLRGEDREIAILYEAQEKFGTPRL